MYYYFITYDILLYMLLFYCDVHKLRKNYLIFSQ